MRSVLEAATDGAGPHCSLCQKLAGTCRCWIKCDCGWSRERGEPCGNSKCKRKPAKGEGRARPKEAVLAQEKALANWCAKVEALGADVEQLVAMTGAPLLRALDAAAKALREQNIDAADWHLDETAMLILAIRARVRELKPKE